MTTAIVAALHFGGNGTEIQAVSGGIAGCQCHCRDRNRRIRAAGTGRRNRPPADRARANLLAVLPEDTRPVLEWTSELLSIDFVQHLV